MKNRQYLLIGPLAFVLGLALIAIGQQTAINADTLLSSQTELANHLALLGYVLAAVGGTITAAGLLSLF